MNHLSVSLIITIICCPFSCTVTLSCMCVPDLAEPFLFSHSVVCKVVKQHLYQHLYLHTTSFFHQLKIPQWQNLHLNILLWWPKLPLDSLENTTELNLSCVILRTIISTSVLNMLHQQVGLWKPEKQPHLCFSVFPDALKKPEHSSAGQQQVRIILLHT